MATELQPFSPCHLHRLGIIRTCHPAGFQVGSRDPSSGPHTCTESTLLPESSPQAPTKHLLWWLHKWSLKLLYSPSEGPVHDPVGPFHLRQAIILDNEPKPVACFTSKTSSVIYTLKSFSLGATATVNRHEENCPLFILAMMESF